jgi:hypothetical protein
MILNKSCFIGPAPPIYFGNKYVKVVNHTTCLGLVIDNRLTWSMHINFVKKTFIQKVGALRRMKKLPTKVLEEIYFKSIIPAVTYGIVVWGNCSSVIMDTKPYSCKSCAYYSPARGSSKTKLVTDLIHLQKAPSPSDA